MNDREAFFQFMDGLKPWAKQELQRRGVQDLNRAMSTAESLVEFRSEKSDSKGKGKGTVGERSPPSRMVVRSTSRLRRTRIRRSRASLTRRIGGRSSASYVMVLI